MLVTESFYLRTCRISVSPMINPVLCILCCILFLDAIYWPLVFIASACIALFDHFCCQSARHVVVLYQNECTYRQTFGSHDWAHCSFLSPPSLQNSKRNPCMISCMGVKYTGWEKICKFRTKSPFTRQR